MHYGDTITLPVWSRFGRAGAALRAIVAWLSERLGDSEEKRLIDQAVKGGAGAEQAFRRLVESHEAWLVHYLFCLTGRRGDAEDLAQECLLRAYLALDRFRGEASFRAWLRRIATNLAYNSRRRQRPTLTPDGMIEVEDQSSFVAQLEARQLLVALLERLPYPYREILVLYHVEEMSVAELAVHLDLGSSAAKMRLKRARDRFLALYDELPTPPDPR